MNTHRSWGMLLFAGLFAVVAIGVALSTYFFESNKPVAALEVVADNPAIKIPSLFPDSDTDGIPDWQEKIIGTNPQNPDTDYDGVLDGVELAQGTLAYFEANTAPTESLSRDLADKYLTLSQDGAITPEERDAAVAELLNAHGTAPIVNTPATLDQLNITSDINATTYAQLLVIILKESSRVKEHELTTFRRSIETKNFSGSPALREAGVLYKSIEEALITMDVPPELATEHLTLINSIGSMAGIVTAMGVWNGDPLTGLIYVNTFVNTEASVSDSISAVLTHAATLIQQT